MNKCPNCGEERVKGYKVLLDSFVRVWCCYYCGTAIEMEKQNEWKSKN